MWNLVRALGGGLLLALIADSAAAQVSYRQCRAWDYEASDQVWWSAVVTTNGNSDYDTRVFAQTFVRAFRQYVESTHSGRENLAIDCIRHDRLGSVTSQRDSMVYGSEGRNQIFTNWSNGLPIATAESNTPPARRGGPPALIVTPPDNRRTPVELAREEAQRAADRQRAAEQAQRAAALQAEAALVRQRLAAEATESRRQAEACEAARAGGIGSCVSPQ